MKNNVIVMVLVAALLGMVAFQEVRISRLKDDLAEAGSNKESPTRAVKNVASGSSTVASSDSEGRTRSSRRDPQTKSGEDETPLEGFGKAMRKMADNPAAKAMFAQAHASTAESIYRPLIDDLDLSDEERKYFVGLLGGEFADEQQMGMKMMGATSTEERKAIAEEMEANKKLREEQIAEFLNNEEDNEAYEAYHERLPEHRQLPGIKAAIASTGNELSSEQETALVDIMHEVRTSGDESKKWEGANAMETMTDPNVIEIFEKDWAAGQTAYKEELGKVLQEDQLQAFIDSQAQMKEFHLAGIKMMQKMNSSEE